MQRPQPEWMELGTRQEDQQDQPVFSELSEAEPPSKELAEPRSPCTYVADVQLDVHAGHLDNLPGILSQGKNDYSSLR